MVIIVSIILRKFNTGINNGRVGYSVTVGGEVTNNNETISAFVSAFSEPKNWVVLGIVAIIGVMILGVFKAREKIKEKIEQFKPKEQ